MKLRFLAVLTALLAGCTGDPFAQSPNRPGLPPIMIGIWSNPYGDDPKLAAVSITPGLPNPYDRWAIAHPHPSAIAYAFWDGRVRQIQYRNDGSVWDNFWWPPKAWLRQGSKGWGGFDFNYGSDPTFLHHRDPRLPPAGAVSKP